MGAGKSARRIRALLKLWHSGGGESASGESDSPGYPGDPHRYRYLFPETYQFIDELTDKLKLNLKVYRAGESPAWQEARYGKLWEQGVEGIEKYNDINKVEPMNRALKELKAQTWFAGLRREQSGSRAHLPVLAIQRGVFKVLPIIDWDNRTVYQYLQKHGLKYHPLWDQGYLSVGDTHTTRKWEPGMAEEETRFFGLKRECGLHEG